MQHSQTHLRSRPIAAGQLRARAGQFHCPRVAVKQTDADIFLQALNLPADGRLRQRQLFRSQAKVQVPRHRFKRAKLAGSNRPGTQVGL